eukprot:g4894.t1
MVDRIIGSQVSNQTMSQKGFVDCTKLLDSDTGECRVISFWSSKSDLEASEENRNYYLGAQNDLSKYVRFRMFKTEHFSLLAVPPDRRRHRACSVSSLASTFRKYDDDEQDIGVEMTPFVRISTMKLRADILVEDVDRFVLDHLIQNSRLQLGFRGAHRLVSLTSPSSTLGEYDRVYAVLTYWSSVGALNASSPGSAYFERNVEGCERFMKQDTYLVTQSVQHLRYERPINVPVAPFFEAGSSHAATFQLTCISLGVGIFVVPSILANVGLVLGLALILLFGLLADVGMQLLLTTADWTGAQNFDDVFFQVFGESGRKVALFAMSIACLTANMSHMKFIATLFCDMQGDDGGVLRTLVGESSRAQLALALFVFGAFALPFCFKRTLGELRHISLVVVVFCVGAATVVCGKCVGRIVSNGHLENVSNVAHLENARQLLDIAPIAAFGYSLVAELFAVRCEAKNPADLYNCAHKACAIVTSIYCVVAITGSFAFEDPSSNLLSVWSADDRVVSWLSLGLITVITLLYPLINFVIVQSIDDLCVSMGAFAKNSTVTSFTRKRYLSVAVLALIIGLDSLIDDLSYVFALAGSLGLGLIAYCLPAIVFLIAVWRRRYADDGALNAPTTRRDLFVAVFAAAVCLVVGTVMTIGSTASVIANIAGH